MTLDEIDKVGLIREAYNIEGITIEESRSIFVDWALRLPMGLSTHTAISLLLQTYGTDENHPMSRVLREGLSAASTPRRRGGRKARVS